jgi:hypothetical protein
MIQAAGGRDIARRSHRENFSQAEIAGGVEPSGKRKPSEAPSGRANRACGSGALAGPSQQYETSAVEWSESGLLPAFRTGDQVEHSSLAVCRLPRRRPQG